MELSRYLKAYPYEEKEGYVLLFSTRNASKILVKEDIYHDLRSGVTPVEKQALLSKLGIVVPNPHQEKKDVLSFFERLNQRNMEITITAVMNLDCNFACLYCYEGEQKGRHYMSQETADSLVGFAQNSLREKTKSLLVDFYGGEPLLSLDLIKDISGKLKTIAQAQGASYRFTLVTNGSLFKRSVAKQLVPLGLYSVRITIDGPADVHNRYRPFKTGRGSFDAVIRNIKETCDLTRVNIGGNYERHNYRLFPLLLDVFVSEGLTPEKIASVKFDPVNKRPEGDPSGLVDYTGGCRSINEPWLAEASTFLREEILKRGYFTPKAGPTVCMVEQKDCFVVGHDGRLYKCPALLGREEFVVGDVGSGIQEYGETHKLDNWKNDNCTRCEYLPLCFGGCRYATFVKDGTIDALDCKKDYFDACLEKIVKQDIRYRTQAKAFTPIGKNGNPITVSELLNTIDACIKNYFPDEFGAFVPPSLEKIASCYRNADRLIQTYVYGNDVAADDHNVFSEQGFISAAMIRYVDDFIDTVLWPRISTFEPAELEERFGAFLAETVQALKPFDPDLPDSITDLLRLEVRLAVHPDQETFDNNVEALFMCKSYDLYYVYRKIHADDRVTVVPKHLIRVALMDYLRDFDEDAIARDTDLNLYAFARDNKLNPKKLLTFLVDAYKREDPDAFRIARDQGLFDGIEEVDLSDPATPSEIPLHDHFASLFKRAIGMLRAL